MIPAAEPCLGEEELSNVVEAIRSGWISSKGKFVLEFEQDFAEYCGYAHGVATSNGTAALHLALEALGIGEGGEVIVPTLTFIATVNAVSYTGAKPVFADSHPDYWCIDPQSIEKAITEKTKAIIPVHLYGHPCDMVAIFDIANRYGLLVIEDASEAHGAEYRGKKVGSFGDIACFSFFASKIVTTGEGGMCLTNDKELAGKMRVLRDHGMNPGKKYWHDCIGFNYRMTNLQAAVGVAQVKKLDEFVEKKRTIARIYSSLLGDIDEVVLPPEMAWATSVYWMYCILFDTALKIRRDEVIARLRKKGVEAIPIFNPIHKMPPHKNTTIFPIAEDLSNRGIGLPSGVNLKPQDISLVVEAVREIISVGC